MTTWEKYHGFDVSVANVAQQIFWHFLPHKQKTSAVNEYFNTARIASQHATHIVKKIMSFLNHKVCRAALISVSLALSQTLVYTVRPWIQG